MSSVTCRLYREGQLTIADCPLIKSTSQGTKAECQEAGEGVPDPQIQLDSGVNGIDLLLVQIGQASSGRENVPSHHQSAYFRSIFRGSIARSLDIAEGRSLDLDPPVAFLGRIDNLLSDVLSLTIAIGPDDEQLAVPCLPLNVLCHSFLVLRWSADGKRFWTRVVATYLRDRSHYRCSEEALRRGVLPPLVRFGELQPRQVAEDGGHGDAAVVPWRAEVEVEGVVFDVLRACVVLPFW